MLEILKRHGATHFANIRYGYALFAAILLHIAVLTVSKNAYLSKWLKTGRSTSSKRQYTILSNNYLVLSYYLVVLTALMFVNFHKSLIGVFIKRFGRFAFILLSVNIFLSLKPNPLPNIYYLQLMFLHKWISRIIILWSFFHSIGFVWKWSVEKRLYKVFATLNLCGLIGFIAFIVILIVTLKPIRTRFYKFFFTTHLILSWLVSVLIIFHARPNVNGYAFIVLVLFITQIITKFLKSKNINLTIKNSANSNLLIVSVPNIYLGDFLPGSHIRLNYSKFNVLNYLLPSHPFTIASKPMDSTIKLVVKNSQNLNLSVENTYSIFGPFTSLSKNFFKTVENVILVSGGSGISYTLGLYQQLLENPSIKIKLIWILRNKSDLWILNEFNVKKIDIYLTTNESLNTSDIFNEGEQLLNDENDFHHDDENYDFENDDDFELENLDPFNDQEETSDKKHVIKFGRPNLALYSNFINKFDKANNWIISCGTKSLNNDCKKLANDLKVQFHSEQYAL